MPLGFLAVESGDHPAEPGKPSVAPAQGLEILAGRRRRSPTYVYNGQMNPTHLSYSSLTTWERCPKQYQLGRIVKAQAQPAWYFVGGTASHMAMEDIDRGRPPLPWTAYFYPEVEKALAREPDHKSWLSGGSPDEPDQGDAWMSIGPLCIDNWKHFTSEKFRVEEIELDVTARLPGSHLKIKGFIDRTGVHADHGKMIVDIKSGKNKPKDKGLQLGVYSALNTMNSGEVITKGAYFMAREGVLSKVYEFDPMQTLLDMGKKFKTTAQEIGAGEFPAKVEYTCRFCDQAPNCYAMSGDTQRTRYYDPDNPHHPKDTEEIPF